MDFNRNFNIHPLPYNFSCDISFMDCWLFAYSIGAPICDVFVNVGRYPGKKDYH